MSNFLNIAKSDDENLFEVVFDSAHGVNNIKNVIDLAVKHGFKVFKESSYAPNWKIDFESISQETYKELKQLQEEAIDHLDTLCAPHGNTFVCTEADDYIICNRIKYSESIEEMFF